MMNIDPNFNSFINFRNVTKWIEQVPWPPHTRYHASAFTQAKMDASSGLIEIPRDVFDEEVQSRSSYTHAPDTLRA